MPADKVATTAVAAAYHQAGWIVRAYLPQQAIDNGVATIEVIEAVLGQWADKIGCCGKILLGWGE